MNTLSRPAYLKFTGIEKKYGKGKHAKLILRNLDIELKGGECTLICGRNGCGKSTLLRIMGGILKPDQATINTGLLSLNWKKYKKAIQNQVMYLYQEPYMFDGSVWRNLHYALGRNQSKSTILETLRWADLEHRRDTQAKCLSGGERQRVALAQAWLKNPEILLLDEPTANMDNTSRQKTETLLATFKESGTAVLIASHDPNHFKRIQDNLLLLEGGQISEKIMPEEHSEDDKIDSAGESLSESEDKIAIFPNRNQ